MDDWGRALTPADQRLLAWARLHREDPGTGTGWRSVFAMWITMVEAGAVKPQRHALLRLQSVKEMVMQGIPLSSAVYEAVREGARDDP